MTEHVAHHPAIQGSHQAVAFGGRNKGAGQDGAAAFIVQAQQDLQMARPFHRRKRRDFLGIEAEAILLQGYVQTLDPRHFAKAQGQFSVVGVVHPTRLRPFSLAM